MKKVGMYMTTVNLKKEMESRGNYPAEGTWYGAPYSPVERLTPPITPAENLLHYYQGKSYEWIPDIVSDQIDITPHCIPDVDACDYTGGYDAFGVKWIPDASNPGLPAFVEPGFILLEDITEWRSLKWPDVESWPWKEYAARYNETYKEDDRLRRGIILSGYFERLISMMSFQEAAVALIEEPEEVAAFFDQLTDLNIQIMDHYIDDFHCESIMIHDDWAAQAAPFFSLETVRTLLVPTMKRLTGHAHERGVMITLHSCGNGTALVPAMIEAGFDAWQAQADAINWDEAYAACGNQLMIESYPVVPDGIHGEELEAFIREYFKKYSSTYRGCIDFYDFDMERLAETRRAIYKVGRELAAELQS